MSWGNDFPKGLLDRVVTKVEVSSTPHEWKDRNLDAVVLVFDNGQRVSADLHGDCCSSSSFTDAKQFDELVGARIRSVEEREGGEVGRGEWDDVRKSHFLVFVTDKGHVTIDWHNDSNGYYDGWVEWREVTP